MESWILYLGAVLLGALVASMGSFVVMQGKTLYTDGISHALLPGILLAFISFESKNPWLLSFGAVIFGLLANGHIHWLQKRAKLTDDQSLAIIMCSYFSLGLILWSYFSKNPRLEIAGLKHFLFGQFIGFSSADLWSSFILCSAVFILLYFTSKLLFLQAFQPQFLIFKSFKTSLVPFLFNILFICVIAFGAQLLGVVLMSALIVLPYLITINFTVNRIKLVIASASFGSLACIGGVFISSKFAAIPVGPTIVLFLVVLFLISKIKLIRSVWKS